MIFNKEFIKKVYNVLGWHTRRKIICIASDDWGCVRLASSESRNELLKVGFPLDDNRFDTFDILESNADMELLYDVLLKHKDSKGNHPVITAFVNIANPDFEAIEASGFSTYHYEPFTETLKRYPNRDRVYQLYLEGIQKNIFIPEFHGREHLNVPVWMNELQKNNPKVRKAFEQKYFLMDAYDLHPKSINGYGAAYDFISKEDISVHKAIIEDGLNLFTKLFSFPSTVFTAPSQAGHADLEPVLYQKGIKLIDVPTIHQSKFGYGSFWNRFNYIGKKNKHNQYYLVRNAIFEPNMNIASDGVDECLNAIQFAFESKKPVIISNHRAAFVGGLDVSNREKGLKALDKLLSEILQRWPDAEFVSARDLEKLLDSNS